MQTQLRAAKSARKRPTVTYLTADHRHRARNPTTSFLTATTLQYAIGAGITTAAGTSWLPPIDPR